MDEANMVIVNGTKEAAKITYNNFALNAKSIVDYVSASEHAFHNIQGIEYDDCRTTINTDHVMLSIHLAVEYKNEAAAHKTMIPKIKDDMAKLKNVRDENFWECFAEHCDGMLEDFEEKTDGNTSIDQDYKIFLDTMKTITQKSLEAHKPRPTTVKQAYKSDRETAILKKKKNRLFREMKANSNELERARLASQLQKALKKLKKRTRAVHDEFMRAKLNNIERMQNRDTKQMWKELKKLAGWKTKSSTPETMFNEEGIEVKGDEVKDVWRRAFHCLGIEDFDDATFDLVFARQVEEEMTEIEEASHVRDQVEELDRDLEYEEVVKWIKKLKLGKAAGVDKILPEIIKRGGKMVAKALYLLCLKAWKNETVADDWSKGMIFPIYKDDEARDPLNYRGITLLSIVGKVYTSILNDRLIQWCEKNNILVEEQGGFRPKRGCPDQIFNLTELLRGRKQTSTFCCFIDVKKAFDRVFRSGMWQRLAEEGICGKMWRVLRSIYAKVESCVIVGDSTTDWFDVDTGVRQGCVLSPVLFAIFINGLAKTIKESNLGIDIGENLNLSILLYADDIVLISDNCKNLQKMMDLVSSYAYRWRFQLNRKKSEVVVFGKTRARRKWRLSGGEVRTVGHYKYLGIEFTSTLNWGPYVNRIVKKARRNMVKAWAMGVSGGYTSVSLGVKIWKSLVQSVVDYGSEFWGDLEWKALDNLQLRMGKKILRCSEKMTNEVVRGELGWWRMRGRRDEARLRYWARLVRMQQDRIPSIVYRESKGRLDREQRNDSTITDSWCIYTKSLLTELGLQERWANEQVGSKEEWNELVRDRIHNREELLWLTDIDRKPKLRTYKHLKKELKLEDYLLDHRERYGRYETTKLRGGTNRLRIEQGRYEQLGVEQRVCQLCLCGAVEDEAHFLLDCAAYSDYRQDMWADIERITGGTVSQQDNTTDLNNLIGDGQQGRAYYLDLCAAVKKFIRLSMFRRKRISDKYIDIRK